MKEVIQFSDNLFYTMELIKTLSIAAELDMNKNLFNKKILRDIIFIDNVLEYLPSLLKEKKEHQATQNNLRILIKSRVAYKDALKELLTENQTLFSAKEEITRIKLILNKQDKKIEALINFMNELDEIDSTEVFTTNEELAFLLEEEV